MKSYQAKVGEIERRWYVVDLEDKVLGRAAARIATVLRGKDRPTYTPNVDTGAFVICVNADKVKLTGSKLDKKIYYRHSGYPGGIRQESARSLLERRPEELVRKAVRGMLPRTRLGRQMLNKLKIYAAPEHPHAAQRPEALEL